MKKHFLSSLELVSFLENKHGFCGIMFCTEPKTLKKGRITGLPVPFKIRKATWMTVIIGTSYENGVNNQREREEKTPDFKAEQLWKGNGERINSSIARHKKTNELYLVYRPINNDENEIILKHECRWYREDTGMEIDINAPVNLTLGAPSFAEEYLPKKSKPKKQETDKEIMWRTVKLKNLKEIHWSGIEHHII